MALGYGGTQVIYGVSQTSGVERCLELGMEGAGVSLTIRDRTGQAELERIVVPKNDLLAAIISPVEGGCSIAGTGAGRLVLQVRRNEVQLTTFSATEGGCDIAVGLDDFQDGLEQVVTAE
jgi:hypothetical protein